ncbi:hypothetical protein D2962_01580 [Biomaibacter acetigenes]|uniref:Uncharacterized protein n=1 Tax=Biomaibacter acetigenes TaxID=2316383 RepID=A0A3G2R1Y0_9FIRM|nr:hypothetical protein D2962_01580 [Biomaibacter acetigenes]RKL61517.1 hypothetical protein DXT63_16195 [Thermoanaerobacteraceae bacterium SP2]
MYLTEKIFSAGDKTSRQPAIFFSPLHGIFKRFFTYLLPKSLIKTARTNIFLKINIELYD